ncbi:MAG: metallophosphoesterase [Chitinophagaceae bacterium]|nr:MAG: metallophosphoesterase [Chitinophagaceae bacterium]
MRTYPVYTLVMLCFAILLVDAFAFYWLQDVTALTHSPKSIVAINIIFWLFTAALIAAILVMRLRMKRMEPQRRQILISSLYGLTVLSFVPKIIFVLAISIIHYSNRGVTDNQTLYWMPLIGLLGGILPFLALCYAIFRSLYRFKVYTHSITIEALPSPFDGLRIVHISDTHLGSFNYRFHIFDRAVQLINNLHPDLILFTGDLVNNYASELKGWEDPFNKLKAGLGKYSVLGNHDYGDYSEWPTAAGKLRNFEAIKAFHGAIGFKLLLNESVLLHRGEENIAIAGVENWGNPPFKQYGDIRKALQDVATIPFKILLSHDPSHWPKEVITQTNISLTLSGHTHGMQAGLSVGKKNWSPIKYKYKHWAGLYKEGDQYLHVNRGLGWLGFPGRVGMRPEITLIELKCQQQH